MKQKLLSYCLLSVCIFLEVGLYAQESSPSETEYFFYKDNPTEIHYIDTGLYNFEQYNFNQTNEWEYFDMGNQGLALYPMSFASPIKDGFQSGMNGFDRYKYSIGRIKYYKTEKPFSQISYTMGTKRENIFHGQLAQNVKNRLEFGVDFMRLASLGIYEGQRTRNSGFSLYNIVHSKNNRYHFGVDMVYNRVKATENGGVVQDFIDSDSIVFANPLFYDTYLEEDALTEQNNIEVLLTNSYDFGFARIDSINDTLSVKRYYPTWRVTHELGIGRERYGYLDESPDSLFYGAFYQIDDSASYDMQFRTLSHAIGVSYLGAIEKNDTIKYRPFVASAFARVEQIKLKERDYETLDFKTNNIAVEGSFSSHPMRRSAFTYQADVKYYLAGYNQHDIHVDGYLSFDMEKWGQARAVVGFHNTAPSWISSYYYRQGVQWSHDFKKTQSIDFTFSYKLPKYKAAASFTYRLINSYIFFDENVLPNQADETINYWQFSLRKDFQWKGLHWDNFVGVQGVSKSEIVRIPSFFLKTSFYLQGKIFKGNMLAKVGADLRYNTRFDIPSWQPLVGQFYLQNEKLMKSTPILDVFISMQVRSLRIFVKANYINQGLIKKNYYTALGYPSRGRTFAGGLTWRFFE